MNDNSKTMNVPDVADRKTGLVVLGIIQILMGAFFALMVPLTLVGLFLMRNTADKGSVPPPSASAIIPGVLFYVLMAIGFIWMGIGSIRARRWARALWLVVSWMWLIGGISGLIFMLAFMPDVYAQMGKNGQTPQQILTIMKYVMLGFMTVFYIVVPGIFVLFYGSKRTKETCERRDPQIRWTDKCPLPVLASSLMFGCWAICMPSMGFYGWTLPFFGSLVSGPIGVVIVFAIMLLFGYTAWGTYHLKIAAWWCAVLSIMIWGISGILTFSRVNLLELYKKMNLPAQQVELMQQTPLLQTPWMLLFCGAGLVITLAYLLYIRKYFTSQEEKHASPGE